MMDSSITDSEETILEPRTMKTWGRSADRARSNTGNKGLQVPGNTCSAVFYCCSCGKTSNRNSLPNCPAAMCRGFQNSRSLGRNSGRLIPRTLSPFPANRGRSMPHYPTRSNEGVARRRSSSAPPKLGSGPQKSANPKLAKSPSSPKGKKPASPPRRSSFTDSSSPSGRYYTTPCMSPRRQWMKSHPAAYPRSSTRPSGPSTSPRYGGDVPSGMLQGLAGDRRRGGTTYTAYYYGNDGLGFDGSGSQNQVFADSGAVGLWSRQRFQTVIVRKTSWIVSVEQYKPFYNVFGTSVAADVAVIREFAAA